MDYFSHDRLLTLWFDFGHYDDVYEALVEGLKTIHIDNWLQVYFIHDLEIQDIQLRMNCSL